MKFFIKIVKLNKIKRSKAKQSEAKWNILGNELMNLARRAKFILIFIFKNISLLSERSETNNIF
jgi:hypothetical protein